MAAADLHLSQHYQSVAHYQPGRLPRSKRCGRTPWTFVQLERSQSSVAAYTCASNVQVFVDQPPRLNQYAAGLPRLPERTVPHAGEGSSDAKLGFWHKDKEYLKTPVRTWKKIIPLALMFFSILFIYTILRDTKVRLRAHSVPPFPVRMQRTHWHVDCCCGCVFNSSTGVRNHMKGLKWGGRRSQQLQRGAVGVQPTIVSGLNFMATRMLDAAAPHFCLCAGRVGGDSSRIGCGGDPLPQDVGQSTGCLFLHPCLRKGVCNIVLSDSTCHTAGRFCRSRRAEHDAL